MKTKKQIQQGCARLLLSPLLRVSYSFVEQMGRCGVYSLNTLV